MVKSDNRIHRIKFISKVDLKSLSVFLQDIDGYFVPPLSQKVNINFYAKKLLKNAYFFIAIDGELIVGLISLYCNDTKGLNAYIPIIAIRENYRGLGLGKELLELAIEHVKKANFARIFLETWENSPALSFYIKNGFEIIDIINNRLDSIKSVKLSLTINRNNPLLIHPIEITPLISLKRLSQKLKINLSVKQDDLFQLPGGGNKARKLHYILNSKILGSFNAIVTAGENQSNHLRATALFASKLGWKLICVIHSKEPKTYEGNLKITQLTGAELRFVKKKEVKETMDIAMNDLKKSGYQPLYIWGGGHCVEGSLAYFEAVKELKEQTINYQPDFIVVASGTGTTQAGLEVGVRYFMPNCKVLGVSIARDKQKGKSEIIKSIAELVDFVNKPVTIPSDIFFDDSWAKGGYESVYPELLETISYAAKTEGLILDPTYTGKAFHALVNYVKNGTIPTGSNVVFWHTGGLLNLLASKDI